jgi:hypothetical protein
MAASVGERGQGVKTSNTTARIAAALMTAAFLFREWIRELAAAHRQFAR